MTTTSCSVSNGLRIMAALVALFLLGCQAQTRPPVTTIPQAIQRVLVLPFEDMSALYGKEANVRSPLSGKVFVTGPVPEDGPRLMTQHLLETLKERTGFHVMVPDADLRAGLLSQNPEQPARRLWVESGREMGADGVMAGHLYRFREREGGKFAAKTPASVAFDLFLIRTDTGRILWSRHFDETQVSLSENLFKLETFLKRDGQWITARQMAFAALEEMLQTLRKP